MKRVVRLIAIVVVALVAIVLALPLLIDANTFRPKLESELTSAIGRDVKLGDLKLSLLSGGITASNLSVADDTAFSRAPFLTAKSLAVGVELMPLIFSRKLNVKALTIDQPQITLLQNQSGKWNLSSLGAKSSPASKSAVASDKAALDLSAKLVTISNGRVSIGEAGSSAKPQELDKVKLELRDFSASAAFPFTLSAQVDGGGSIKIEGKAGPIDAGADIVPVGATLTVTHLDLAASGIVKPSSGMEGIVSFDGSATSNGRTARMLARVKAEKLKLARGGSPASQLVEFDCTIDHDMARRSGQLSRGDIHIGKATASLTGTYSQQGEAPALNMKFSGDNMPLPEIAAMLPALDIALPAGSSIEGGVASAHFNLLGPGDRLAGSGSFTIANARLAGFNLGAKMSAVQRLAGVSGGRNTDIQTLSANVNARPEGTSVQDFKLVAPAIGELTGAGTISPAHALDFKIMVLVHTPGTMMAALGQKGDTRVPCLIQGTSSNPVFLPDVGAIAAGEAGRFIGGERGKAVDSLLKGLLGGKKQK